ncbi:uncharacterized protein ColSpa_04548 [Colletotrichum spaethianum]|uniref:Acyltransferase 3 domain-containing protein n=1 Tax=Colletotrichum spaethianum TaxID=700344 RepID=A0AA37LHU7_9PEZI|nr:uncharacterized protein ColSpa_04548 [Colletotrichum spaethianum]GKT44367.1 hypothetical protein ColSpa_04548 [Colletotrichum spaethianum]
MDKLDSLRSWIAEALSGKKYTALLEDGTDALSAEGLLHEPKSEQSRWRTNGARNCFWVMMPSYLARAFGHASDNSEIPAANATSDLNGLRGIASVIVALQHTVDADYPLIHRGWGDTDDDHHLIQLPIVRMLTSGILMVDVFFIISGFALTYGPLKKSYGGQSAAAISSMPSSIFRRPFRLFMPVIPVLAVTTVLVYLQAFYALNSTEPMAPVASGFWDHIYYIWRSLVLIITAGTNNTIMPQGWTLTAEYEGSILVFLCCMAFVRTSPKVRIPLVLSLLIFLFNLGRLQQCLFLTGMLLADFRHERKRLPNLPGAIQKAVTLVSWMMFVLALFLGGWPVHGNAAAAMGFSWFAWVPTFGIPAPGFFQFVSSIMLVVALENLPVLQRVLNMPWALYLGEISYGLYLVHWVCGKCFLTYGLKLRLVHDGHSLAFAWSVLFAITVVLTLWLGDVHWRLVDQRCVRFAHWLSKKLGI